MAANQRAQIERDGFVILKDAIPPELVQKLSWAHAEGEEVLRRDFGPTAHRLQSLEAHGIDMALCRQLVTVPALGKFYRSFPEERHFGPYREDPFVEISFIFSPVERSRCTYWHRDWRDRSLKKCLDATAFRNALNNFSHFLGITFALQEDSSFWYVPGSQNRNDLEGELSLGEHANLRWQEWDRCVQEHFHSSGFSGSYDDFLLAYAASMPGAVRISLSKGDILIFVTLGWHLGLYMANSKRVAMQGVLGSDFFAEWCEEYSDMRRSQTE